MAVGAFERLRFDGAADSLFLSGRYSLGGGASDSTPIAILGNALKNRNKSTIADLGGSDRALFSDHSMGTRRRRRIGKGVAAARNLVYKIVYNRSGARSSPTLPAGAPNGETNP